MRMWTLLEIIAMAIIVLISITEFFIPLIMNRPLFGSFRKTKNKNEPETKKADPSSPLKEKVNQAKEKVEEVKDVQEEVTKNYRQAKDLKKEADDLL